VAAVSAAAFISCAAAHHLEHHESVEMVPKKGLLYTAKLETTIFRPRGDGPFPVVIINHGKQEGNPHFQNRFRPEPAALYFLDRGYLVVVPMRQGFSHSTGKYIGAGCNVESNGISQAHDDEAVLAYLAKLPYADHDRILVVGVSHGGWTSLALGALHPSGVKGLVNFAGGLRQEDCVAWESALARAAGSYGRRTEVPSLWLYGDNDTYFSARTFAAMFRAYTAGGGHAKLVDYGEFGNDAHLLFVSREGREVWEPQVTAFLKEIGLPYLPVTTPAKP